MATTTATPAANTYAATVARAVRPNGRINAARLVPGDRILLAADAQGTLQPAVRKRDAVVGMVLRPSESMGGGMRNVATTAGVVRVFGQNTFIIAADEAPAAPAPAPAAPVEAPAAPAATRVVGRNDGRTAARVGKTLAGKALAAGGDLAEAVAAARVRKSGARTVWLTADQHVALRGLVHTAA